MPAERNRGVSNVMPSFPFVGLSNSSPSTPRRTVPPLVYDAAKTHAIDSPLLASPFSGLVFGKSGRVLSRQGALVSIAPPILVEAESPAEYYEGSASI